jgi:hypothetical protein
VVGEQAEVLCYHVRDGELIREWLRGAVVHTDARMAAVRFDVPVFTNQGLPVPDRTLWSAHGSPRIRHVGEQVS